MKKAVAYCRVSSKRQGKSGLGLEAQRKAIQEFARQNNMHIIAEFKEVESGRKNDRPIMAQVLETCKRSKATLLIARVDRLARRLLFIVTLMESDIPFISVDRPHADEYELHMEAANAQRESKIISKRTTDSLRIAKLRGVKLGTAVFELIRKKRQQYKAFAKRMKPVIIRLQKKGITTTRQLVAALNDKHIKTFQGHECHWHNSTVHRLLKAI